MLIRRNNYIDQIKKSKREKKRESSSFDLPFVPPFKEGDLRRLVFCSVAVLSREWRKIPRDVLDQAIFCFSCDRSWCFHKFSEGKGSEKQLKYFKKQFDSRFMDFEADFLELIKEHEKDDRVYWHRPEKDYAKMSAFFEKIPDTVMKDNLNPLILDEKVWIEDFGEEKMWQQSDVWKAPPPPTEAPRSKCEKTTAAKDSRLFDSKVSSTRGEAKRGRRKKKIPHNIRRPRFTSSVRKVVTNFQSGSTEPNSLKELIFQSNPTLSFYIPGNDGL